MEKSERVVSHSRYDYYKYYNLYKDRYKTNYEEKKRRNELEIKHRNYYKDFGLITDGKTKIVSNSQKSSKIHLIVFKNKFITFNSF